MISASDACLAVGPSINEVTSPRHTHPHTQPRLRRTAPWIAVLSSGSRDPVRAHLSTSATGATAAAERPVSPGRWPTTATKSSTRSIAGRPSRDGAGCGGGSWRRRGGCWAPPTPRTFPMIRIPMRRILMKGRRRWNRTIYRGPSPRGSPSHRRRRCREWVDLRGCAYDDEGDAICSRSMSWVDCSAYFLRSVNDFGSCSVSVTRSVYGRSKLSTLAVYELVILNMTRIFRYCGSLNAKHVEYVKNRRYRFASSLYTSISKGETKANKKGWRCRDFQSRGTSAGPPLYAVFCAAHHERNKGRCVLPTCVRIILPSTWRGRNLWSRSWKRSVWMYPERVWFRSQLVKLTRCGGTTTSETPTSNASRKRRGSRNTLRAWWMDLP